MHSTSTHRHLSISFISVPFVLFKIWTGQATLTKNGYREITQYIHRVGLWFLGSVLPLIAIYLYTQFYLNVTSSFKVICWTRYRTDGQSDDYMLPPLGSIKKQILMWTIQLALFIMFYTYYCQNTKYKVHNYYIKLRVN